MDEVADEVRDRLVVQGARLSYRQNCEAMQRVHVSPALGKRRVESVKHQDVERLARGMLARGSAPKTVRNAMTFLHSVLALGQEPVGDCESGGRRHAAEASSRGRCESRPAVPHDVRARRGDRDDSDVVVDRDVFGPVLRVIILTAGTTGIRQSELLGMRWRDIDMAAHGSAFGTRGCGGSTPAKASRT